MLNAQKCKERSSELDSSKCWVKPRKMYLADKAADVPLSIHGLQGLVSDRFLAASALGQGPVHVAIFTERLALETTQIKG